MHIEYRSRVGASYHLCYLRYLHCYKRYQHDVYSQSSTARMLDYKLSIVIFTIYLIQYFLISLMVNAAWLESLAIFFPFTSYVMIYPYLKSLRLPEKLFLPVRTQ